jgi:transposase-like protein
VPAGARHNVKNTGDKPLKRYTLYSHPEHIDGVVHPTRSDADAAHEHFDGRTSEEYFFFAGSIGREAPCRSSDQGHPPATRKQYGAEQKIRIVLEGLRGEEWIAAVCRREGIAVSLYYTWSKEFLEAGKNRMAGTTSPREVTLRVLKRSLSEAGVLFHRLKRRLS